MYLHKSIKYDSQLDRIYKTRRMRVLCLPYSSPYTQSANVPAYVKDIGEDATSITSSAVVSGYATAVSELHNKGEDLVTLDNLKHASIKLLLSSTSR